MFFHGAIMTIQTTGQISVSEINAELGFTNNDKIAMDDIDPRILLKKTSGQISIADAYSKFAKYSVPNKLFYVADSNGDIYTSPDTSAWTKVFSLGGTICSIVSNDKCVIATNTVGKVAVTYNGTNWALITLPNCRPTCSVYGNNKFIILCMDGEIFTSSDGFIWTKSLINTKTNYNVTMSFAGYDPLKQIYYSGFGGGRTEIWKSTDGENWSIIYQNNFFQGGFGDTRLTIFESKILIRYLFTNTGTSYVYGDPDIGIGSYNSNSTSSQLQSEVCVNGKYTLVTSNGEIYSSTNLTLQSKTKATTSIPSAGLKTICYGNELYFTGGNYGDAMSSISGSGKWKTIPAFTGYNIIIAAFCTTDPSSLVNTNPAFSSFNKENDLTPYVTDVATDNGGNIYIAGSINNKDILIIKLNTSNDIVWSKSISGAGTKGTRKIHVDKNNDLIIVGSDINISGTNTSFITKLNANGILLYSKTFTITGAIGLMLTNISSINNNNYILTGMVNIGGVSYGIIMQTSSDVGSIAWSKKYNYTNSTYSAAMSVAINNANEIYVLLSSVRNGGYLEDLTILKLNTSGTILLQTRMGTDFGIGSNSFYNLKLDSNNNLILSCQYDYGSGVIGWSAFNIIKFSSSLILNWVKGFIYGSGGEDYCRGIAIDSNNNIGICYTTNNDGANPKTGLLILDTNSNIINTYVINHNISNTASLLAIVFNYGNFYLAGTNSIYSGYDVVETEITLFKLPSTINNAIIPAGITNLFDGWTIERIDAGGFTNQYYGLTLNSISGNITVSDQVYGPATITDSLQDIVLNKTIIL